MQIRRCRPNLPTLNSSPSVQNTCFVHSAVIEGSVVMKNADLMSYKISKCVLTKVDSLCRRKNVRMGLDSF